MTKQNQKAQAQLPKPTKRRVPLKKVTTDEPLFQPRFSGLVERHVAALQDVLRRGVDLDPISLWEDPDSGELIVTDGHHRLEAYRRERPRNNVPALIYRCDRHTALLLPMVDNAKTRLNLSYDEKANKAWRLTVEAVDLSAKGLADLCGISKRTVNYMRRIKTQLDGSEADEDEMPKSWRLAQAVAKGEEYLREWDEDERAEREEAEVNRADEAFGAQFSELFRRWPSAGVRLVERCAGDQGERVILDEWGAAIISDDEEKMGVLAMRLGEVFTAEELEDIMARAKTWAY